MPTARELGKMLEDYQAGKQGVEEVEPIDAELEQPQMPVASHGDISLTPVGTRLITSQNNEPVSEYMAEEAVRSGWGDRPRLDVRTGFYEGMDVEDARAREQSGFWKIANGLNKGLVTTAATAVNTTAGVVAGLGSALFELGEEVFGPKDLSAKGIMNAAANNAVTETMTQLQQLSEEWFPNYRTEEERSEQYQRDWWKPSHLFSANTIGDTFLKNFGFTAGAMLGGAAASRVTSKVLQARLANDVMRGVVGAAKGDAASKEALTKTLQTLREGSAASVDVDKFFANVNEARKAVNKLDMKTQLIGAIVGAMGEGTTEGMMARDEYLEEAIPRLENDFAEAYRNIENEIIAEHPEWCSPGMGYDEEGRLRSDIPVLSAPEGFAELARRRSEMEHRHRDLMEYAQRQGDQIAGTTFLLNQMILTPSNFFEYGRMLSGGWKTTRKALSEAAGSIFDKSGNLVGGLRATINPARRAALESLKVGAIEMGEEMLQGTVSSGAKRVADYRITKFNDDPYDRDVRESWANWFRDMYAGGSEYLMDSKNWQEGFMGLVTGWVGVPGLPGSGQRWAGGIYDAVRSARGEAKLQRDAVNKINSLVESKDFQERWKGYARHMKYDNEMGEAASEDNQYAWHTADDKQLISDIILFDKIGKLNSLDDLIDKYAGLSLSDTDEINTLRSLIASDEKIDAKTISDSEVLDRVSKQAKRMKDTIREYKQIKDMYETRMPIGTPTEMLDEILFTAGNIKRFEHRFLDMFGEVMEAIRPALKLAVETDDSIKSEDREKRFEDLYNEFAQWFTAEIPVNFSAFHEVRRSRLKDLYDFTSFDKNLQDKVGDMIRLTEDRNKFFEKIAKLENLSPEKFEQMTKSNEKEVEKAKQDAAKAEVNSAQTINDIKQIYLAKPFYEGADFVQQLMGRKDLQPHEKGFVDLYKTHVDFFNYAWKNLGVLGLSPALIDGFTKEIFRAAKDKDDYTKFDLSTIPDAALERVIANVASIASASNEERRRIKDNLVSIFKITQDLYNRGANPFNSDTRNQILSIANGIQEGINGPVPASAATPAAPQAMPGLMGLGTPTLGTTGSQPAAPVPMAAPAFPPAASLQTSGSGPAEAPRTPVTLDTDNPENAFDGKLMASTPAQNAFEVKDDFDTPTPGDAETKRRESGKAKKNYIRTRIPEMALSSVEKLQEILNISDPAERAAELKKFKFLTRLNQDSPQYAKVYAYLQDKNAFENMLDVQIGDKISFKIDPALNDPDAEYDTPILMYHGDKCVGVLPETGPFTGIDWLVDAIRRDYRASAERQNNEVFTFREQDVVYGKLKGIVDYNYLTNSDMPIGPSMSGYEENAPIVMIGLDGRAQNVRGNGAAAYNRRLDRKYEGLSDEQERAARAGIRGRLYYLTDSGTGELTPIRLNVEHLTKRIYEESESARVAKIRDWFNETLPGVLKATLERLRAGEPMAEVLADQNERLHRALGPLTKLLDIHNIFFQLGVNDDGYVDIVVNWNNLSKDKYEELKKAGEADKIKKEYSSFAINTEPKIEDAVQNILSKLLSAKHSLQIDIEHPTEDYNELLNDGMITTNARSLRVVNSDILLAPWSRDANDGNGGFVPKDYQQKLIDNARDAAQQRASQVETPAPEPAPAPATASIPTPIPAPETIAGEIPRGAEVGEFQIVGARPTPVVDTREAQQRKADRIKMAAAASPIYRELMKANSINMNMSDKKLRERLAAVGVSTPVIRFLIEGLKQDPSLRRVTPYEAFTALARFANYDLLQEYNKGIKEKVDDKLDDFLVNFLAKYNVDVRKADLKQRFDREDIAGAFDVVKKIIWLSENPNERNKLTMPEEFAHAFVELMGSSLNYGADSEDFKFLYNAVATTDIYHQVYETYKDVYKDKDGNPDEYRIRKEAIGQALAAAIVHNWNAKKLGKNDENKGFWNQLKDWFERIIEQFKGANLTFEKTIDDIAREVLSEDTHRLKKVDDTGFTVLDYAETFRRQNEIDGGKALGFMRWFSSIGNLITGSLAYRRQGIVKRGKLDSLHDIDMIVPAEVHGIHNVELLKKYGFRTRGNQDFIDDVLSSPYFKKVKEKYPKMIFPGVFNSGEYITVNGVYSENEALSKKFAGLSGSYASRLEQFTEEERRQIYLFDFFLRTPEKNNVERDDERGLNLVRFDTPIREKLNMGRAKDIYDYQMWKTYQDYSQLGPNPMDLLFQITNPDRQQKAIDEHIGHVSTLLDGENPGRDGIEISKAVISALTQGSDKVSRLKESLINWADMNTSIFQHQNDFADVLNMVVTADEKSRLALAFADAYGVAPSRVDVFEIMRDYSEWQLTHVFNKGDLDSQNTIKAIFERLDALGRNREAVLSNMSYLSAVVNDRIGHDNGTRIGEVNALDDFDSLPKDIRNILKSQGLTADEYDMAPRDLQDKFLRCAGV